MSEKVRVRFAPSPTGTLHIGGARTALFNYLFARNQGGTFILRIEDTDQVRSTPESLQTIYDGLNWLEITWDEGPFFQSQRKDRYREAASGLMNSGRAYEREDPGKGKALIFRIDRETIEWDDCVHGKIGRDISKDPDLVILKSDGFPTYNFACVVDDLDMNITHVIRGDDHVSNTPKQISLFRAMGKEPPRYAHIPLILNPDGSKMSKDYKKKNPQGKEELIPTSLTQYRDLGYMPEAMFNFLALLGWSPGNDVEIMPREELIRSFSLERVIPRGAQFNIEKLHWLNGHVIRQKSLDDIVNLVRPYLAARYDLDRFTPEQIRLAVQQQHERLKTLAEIADLTKFYFQDAVDYDPQAVNKVLKKDGARAALEQSLQMLTALEPFSAHTIEEQLKQVTERLNTKFQNVAQPIRVSVTGTTVSPPIHDTLVLLGKERSLKRISEALKLI